MVRKKKPIDASKADPSKAKFQKVSKKEEGEVEAISARSELNRRGLLSAKQALDLKTKREGTPSEKIDMNKPGLNFVIGEAPEETIEKQGVISRGLDLVSAPLAKPGTTFKEGIGAGAEAVKEGRERIRGGDRGEFVSTALTIATTTGVAAGALLTGTGVAQALAGLTSIGLKQAGVGLATLYGINEIVFSPSELGAWAAVDNVAGALSFQISELDNGVRDGTVGLGEAQETINSTRETINDMRFYVNRQAERNPKLWASSKVFNQAIDVAEGRVTQIEQQIFG
jgi:hypothetical protein